MVRAVPHLGVMASVFAVVGCDTGRTSHNGTPTSEPDPAAPAMTDPAPQPQSANDVFADDVVRTYRLTLADGVWQQLQRDARDELYVPAELDVDGESYGRVALRFKGSAGTLDLCFDENDERVCPKLSMKIKFSEYDIDKRFAGLKRLNFHSMHRDPTLFHERLAYGMFREMGIPAPRSTHANLEVNGERLGLFALVEQIDGRFTDDRFAPNGDGNLYKEAWPTSDNPDHYAEKIKTNEATATHDRFIRFHEALEADAVAALDQWTDLDHLFRYLAVDQAITNWDGIMAIYCGSWGCGNHNYYWYEAESEDFFTLIPWDLDNTLVLSSPHGRLPSWDEDPGDCTRRYAAGDLTLLAPACDPVIAALASMDRSRYLAAVSELLDGPFVMSDVEAKLERWADLIAPSVEADPTVESTGAWRDLVDVLARDVGLLRSKQEALLRGESPTAFTLSATAVNDVEAVDALSLLTSITIVSSKETTAFGNLNTDSPLAGASDIRVDFIFRNGDQPWAQWCNLEVPFADSSVDLGSATSLRFRIRTDESRTVRIALDSDAYAQASRNVGAFFGWIVDVDSTPALVALDLADAQVPEWATSNGETLAEIRASVTSLLFIPEANGRTSSGFLPNGGEDRGFIQIDDIEIL